MPGLLAGVSPDGGYSSNLKESFTRAVQAYAAVRYLGVSSFDLDEMQIEDPLTRRIHIKMSGCPNGCSQHHLANIGDRKSVV